MKTLFGLSAALLALAFTACSDSGDSSDGACKITDSQGSYCISSSKVTESACAQANDPSFGQTAVYQSDGCPTTGITLTCTQSSGTVYYYYADPTCDDVSIDE